MPSVEQSHCFMLPESGLLTLKRNDSVNAARVILGREALRSNKRFNCKFLLPFFGAIDPPPIATLGESDPVVTLRSALAYSEAHIVLY
jgi:hypothetical protein